MARQATDSNLFLKVARVAAIAITGLALATTAIILYREAQWVKPESASDAEAFLGRSIGTEFVPLPVLQVLPVIFANEDHFQPLGKDAGDWIEQFGFLHPDEENPDGLPLGFTVSNYRPKSGAPSPVKFVGIGCATCHSTRLHRAEGDRGFLVLGAGNSSLNLFAWLDAFQKAMLDEQKLTLSSIEAAYKERNPKGLTFEERGMLGLWLSGFRETLHSNLAQYDAPFGGKDSITPDAVPTGPGRTQPFRTLVRTVLDRPGTTMKVYTKVASVFHGDWQKWLQFDGGIRGGENGLKSRSALAVLAAGATLQNMAVTEIESNVIGSTRYVGTLAGPTYAEVFPDWYAKIDHKKVDLGRAVYMRHCNECHGHPGDNGNWFDGPRSGEIEPYEKIGTDPERVTFRYFETLPDKLFRYFPINHPFKFAREDLRPGPLGQIKGYVNKPIDSAFCRAPYLHNASVMTMADLINLKERPHKAFLRGRHVYDPQLLGLKGSDKADAACYFLFDPNAPGNSNKGHDYPWRYQDKANGWNEDNLKDLLEYLKTI
jgi:hypothetical protein